MSTTKIQNTLQVNVPDLKSTLPDLKIRDYQKMLSICSLYRV